MSEVARELSEGGVPALADGEPVEKVVLPTAEGIAAEKDHQNFLSEIAAGKEGLRDVPDPKVKAALPTPDDIRQEKTEQELRKDIQAFPKESLNPTASSDVSAVEKALPGMAEEPKKEAAEADETAAKYADWDARFKEYCSTIGARTFNHVNDKGEKVYGRELMLIFKEYTKFAAVMLSSAALETVAQMDLARPGPVSGGGGGFASWRQSQHMLPVGPPQRQQIVIARPSSGKVELNKAEHAWKPADATKTVEELSKKIENVADEEERLKLKAEAHVAAIKLLKKRTRGILNKITPTSFQDLLSDFTSLLTIKDPGHEKTGYQMDCSWDQAETEAIIEALIGKAVEEPLQCPTYADLCCRVVDVQLERPGNQNRSSMFRNVLVETCQRFFEADWDERPSDGIAKKLAAATDVMEERKLEAELNETRNKEKRRITGTIRFIAELYMHRVFKTFAVHSCAERLFQRGDEESLACLCELLETVGSKLEDQSDANKDKLYNQIGGYYQRLVDISSGKPHKVSTRIKFMILDLIDYRKTGWKGKKGKKETGPKKLEEVREDFQREQAALEAMAKEYMGESWRSTPPMEPVEEAPVEDQTEEEPVVEEEPVEEEDDDELLGTFGGMGRVLGWLWCAGLGRRVSFEREGLAPDLHRLLLKIKKMKAPAPIPIHFRLRSDGIAVDLHQ